VVLAGLQGLVDDMSWRLREELWERFPAAVARSLGGAAALEPRAQRLRAMLAECASEELLKTLTALDDEAAWQLRDRFAGPFANAAMSSLAGLDGERAWALRDAWLTRHREALAGHYELARVAARSVQGVGSARAWELRELARPAAPLSFLSSVTGLTCDRSFAVRAAYLPRAPKAVMETLNRVSDPRAWELRRNVAKDTKEALDSIRGLDDADAWELRDAYADVWPSTVAKSLGALADGARGAALMQRQLAGHADNISLLKHAAAVALGVHRSPTSEE
jgi:dTMP kinase